MTRMLREYVALMRPKHYLKNGLIFLPLVFSGRLGYIDDFLKVVLATIAFSFVASAVYIINDIRDVEKDRQHPKKKLRPIASGKISVTQASILAAGLLLASIVIGYFAHLTLTAMLVLLLYLSINIAYSFGLKNIPIIDVGLLAAGFVLRVVFGVAVIDESMSRWLYLTILAGAFYLGLGKRRNEIATNGTKSRNVNKFYTYDFLDKNMYVCLALTLVFYSLWATDPLSDHSLFLTIPLVILLFMAYSLNIEKKGSMGDPVDVLTNDRVLSLFAIAYVILTTYIIYA